MLQRLAVSDELTRSLEAALSSRNQTVLCEVPASSIVWLLRLHQAQLGKVHT